MADDQVVDLKTSESIFANNESDLKNLFEEYKILRTEVCIAVW